jgi:cytochrome P450
MYVVARHADVMRVVHDPDTFGSAAALPPIWEFNPPEVIAALRGVWPDAEMLIETDGPRHRAVRHVFLRAFTVRRIRDLKERMRERGNALANLLAEGPERADLREFADRFVVENIHDILGLPGTDVDVVADWTAALTALWNPTIPTAEKLAAVDTLDTYRPYLVELIARRRARPDCHRDLIADLARGRRDDAGSGGLTDDEIMVNILGSRIAGLDMTRDTITSTARVMLDARLWHVAGEAHRRDRARLITRCRDEAWRRHTPHRSLCRVITREVELGDVVLPAGAGLLVCFGAANLDPAVFPDPLAIDIDRPNPDEHTAFDRGPHAHGDKGLALAEVTTALEVLVRRLPHLELTDELLTYTPSLHFHGLAALPVHIGPRPGHNQTR